MSRKVIGSYEAKTHLPALLREVVDGERISITKKGVPIAMLVPIERIKPNPKSVINHIRALRECITLGDNLSIKEMIEEGRR